MFQSRGLCLDKVPSAELPRPTSWLQRPTSCFQRGSIRLSADNTSSNEVYTSFVYAQGIRCTLQQRPSNSARVTSRNYANRAHGRPVNSALGRVEDSMGRGKTHTNFNRPVTAPGGGGGLRDLGHGVQLKNTTEYPRVPCISKPDNSDGQKRGRWRRSPFSGSSTLHLYLPSTSLCEDEQLDLENEGLRSTGQNVVPSETTENVQTPTLSESVTMQSTTKMLVFSSQPETNQVKKSPLTPSVHCPSEDIIRPPVLDATFHPMFQEKTHHRTPGPEAPKQTTHAHDIEAEQKQGTLKIIPAAVHKDRAPTSVTLHVDRLPKIKTTKTFVWGLSGPHEIRSMSVLQSHTGMYT